MTSNQDLQGRADQIEQLLLNIPASWQTGILTFERSKGGVKETGDIVFLHGQMIDSHAGGHVGQEALEWLKTWRACSYNFVIKAPHEIELPSYKETPATTQNNNSSVFSPFSFMNQVIQNFTPTETTNQSASTQNNYSNTSKSYNPSTPPQQYTPPTPPQPQIRAPYRLMEGPQVLAFIRNAGLSRQHRHIFFLLDGQRTVPDLVRLTQRPIHEIQALLSDLEQYGLIKNERNPYTGY